MRLRGVGEPIFPERRPDELVEAHRHEALLNLAFLDTGSFWLVCPYDLDALPDAVIEEARRNHPRVSRGGQSKENGLYLGLEALSAPFDAPLSPRPSEAAEVAFDSSSFDALPRLVAERATEAGLSVPRRIDLVVAVSEIARSGGEGAVYLWRDGGRILCEINGRNGLSGPLADRLRPRQTRTSASGSRTSSATWSRSGRTRAGRPHGCTFRSSSPPRRHVRNAFDLGVRELDQRIDNDIEVTLFCSAATGVFVAVEDERERRLTRSGSSNARDGTH